MGPGAFELVTLPIAGGLALGEDKVARRTTADQLATGHPALTTLAVTVRDGGFLSRRCDGDCVIQSGQSLASVLSQPIYGGDVRMWLKWPTTPDERYRLHTNLGDFADATGATVWAPPDGGAARVIPGCADLGVLDHIGRPARWRMYAPHGSTGPAAFESDLDGRLVPVGGVWSAPTPAVPLITVSPGRIDAMAEQYGRLASRDGLFLIDLAVLADGRLAARRRDGWVLSLGTREFRSLLTTAGWTDEAIVVLSPVPADAVVQLSTHAAGLFADLGVEAWGLQPACDWVVLNGQATAVTFSDVPGEWRRLGSGPPGQWRSEEGRLVPAARSAAVYGYPAAGTAKPWLRGHQAVAKTATDQPSFIMARRNRPTGLNWLRNPPMVNAEPIELYLRSTCKPTVAAAKGVPSPDPFLVGRLDPLPPPGGSTAEYVLRVRVEPGGAVDLRWPEQHVPPAVALQLCPRAYLIPAGLLHRVTLLAGYLVEESGALCQIVEFAGTPILLRYANARHGIDGLPNDVPRWPRTSTAAAYALLPGPTNVALAGWIPLRRKPPKFAEGRLVQLRIERRQALDVAAVANQSSTLTSVRSRLGQLSEAGIELILPMRSYERTSVVRVLEAQDGHWQVSPGATPQSIADAFRTDIPPQ